jgi:hypothetical protein
LIRNRVTHRQKLVRDIEIQKRMIEGWSTAEIVKVYSDKWNCTDVNVRKYIGRVKEHWRDMIQEQLPTLRNKYMERLEMMFRECYDAGNYKTALDVQKEIHRICGLHDEKREDGSLAPVITISPRRAAANEYTLTAIEGSTDAATKDEEG